LASRFRLRRRRADRRKATPTSPSSGGNSSGSPVRSTGLSERDALAAWAPRLEVVRRPGEHFAARQSPREPPAAARWSADPIRGSPMRPDPEAVAPARAQLAEAEAEARRREEIDVQRS